MFACFSTSTTVAYRSGEPYSAFSISWGVAQEFLSGTSHASPNSLSWPRPVSLIRSSEFRAPPAVLPPRGGWLFCFEAILFLSTRRADARGPREAPGGLPRRCCSAEPPSTCGGMRRKEHFFGATAAPAASSVAANLQISSRVRERRAEACMWSLRRRVVAVRPLAFAGDGYA